MSSAAERNRRQTIDLLRLSVRSSNCLRASGIETVEQLAQLTALELLRFPNLGLVSLREIERALHKRGLLLGMSHEEVERSVVEDDEIRRGSSFDIDTSQNAATVLDAVACEQQALAYLGQFPSREQAIMRHRIFRSRMTLEELGQQFGVTRERIRQLETRLKKELNDYFASMEGLLIRRYATELQKDLGSAVPSEWLDEYCRARLSPSIASADDLDLVAAYALWVAGPYCGHGRWISAGDFSTEDTAATLLARLDERGWISPAVARDTLLGAGIREVHHKDWLGSHGFVVADEGWLPKLRNIPDRVEQILRYRGMPVQAEELYILADCESERSLRNRLLEDKRFKKISRQGHFALSEWPQYEEYSGIAEEIAEEIEKQGGSAKSEVLIEELSKRYGVSPNSVYQYLSAPMFIKGTRRICTPSHHG